MKKILLAGGAGYIGTELCKRLMKLDYDITVIDDLWFGNNLDKNIKLIKKDIFSVTHKDLIEFDVVIFVDAYKSELENGFAFERIYPAEEVSFSTHSVPPNQILNLCETLYAKKPKAYLMKIQGYNWDINFDLSKTAKTNLTNAYTYFIETIYSQ